MEDIYRKAQCVLAWLGPEEITKTQLAVGTLDSLASKVDVDWETRELIPRSNDLKTWTDRGKQLPFNDVDWNAIQALCSSPWFERLWIRQEILLANEAKLIWGSSILPWESFRKAIFCIYNKPRHPNIADSFRERMELLDGLFNKEEKPNLAYAIYLSRRSKCIDPRDRIYALLELVSEDRNEWEITADYSKTVLEIYKIWRLDTMKRFRTLGFCGFATLVPENVERAYLHGLQIAGAWMLQLLYCQNSMLTAMPPPVLKLTRMFFALLGYTFAQLSA